MSAKWNSASNVIPGNEVKPLHAVHWQGHDFLCFQSASTLVPDAHGDTVQNIAPVVAGNSVSILVEKMTIGTCATFCFPDMPTYKRVCV